MLDQTLESWLGVEGAKGPTEIIKQAREALKWAVDDRVRRAREDFDLKYNDPGKRKKIIEDASDFEWWKSKGKLLFSPDGDATVTCPACAANAVLLGSLWDEDVLEVGPMDEDSYEYETVDQHFTPEEFYCPACELHLYGVDEIAAAGLQDEFSVIVERERSFEPDYMNE